MPVLDYCARAERGPASLVQIRPMPAKWDRFPFRLAKAGRNRAKPGPRRVAIGVKRQADTAPATAGIRGKGRLWFLYLPITGHIQCLALEPFLPEPTRTAILLTAIRAIGSFSARMNQLKELNRFRISFRRSGC